MTTYVSTSSALRKALASGAEDITITQSITGIASPIKCPRQSKLILRGQNNPVLKTNGADFRLLDFGDDTGGHLVMTGLILDGGWLAHPGECETDDCAPLYAPDMDYVSIGKCATRYSRKVGFNVAGTDTVRVTYTKGYCMPRDFLWSNDCRSVLVDHCTVTYCGDDGIGSHQSAGRSIVRDITITNNVLRNCLGIKVLGTGKIKISGNTVTASAFYGVRLGCDPATGEGDTDLADIEVSNNSIIDLQCSTPCHPGQVYGAPFMLTADGRKCTNVRFVGNTISWPHKDGQMFRTSYPDWAGKGQYSKEGFLPNGVFDMASGDYQLEYGAGSTVTVE